MKTLYKVNFGYSAIIYVFENSYDEAGRKALNYKLDMQEKENTDRILTDDGSLNFSDGKSPKVTSIEIITDPII